MKVIVADKISERGVKLLKEQAGWNVVLTTKETIGKELADADAGARVLLRLGENFRPNS